MSITSTLNKMQGPEQQITTSPLDQVAKTTSPEVMYRDPSRKLTRCKACETWLAYTSSLNHKNSGKHAKNLELYLKRELRASASTPATKNDVPELPASIPGKHGKLVVWTRDDDEHILEGWFQLKDGKEIALEIGKSMSSVNERRITLMKDDSPTSLYLTILRRYNPQSR
jgi:hypothetical protein